MFTPRSCLQRLILVRLGQLAAKEPCYLVGGAVRDVLAGRMGADLDFAFPADPTPIARQLAETLGGHWFFLDEERRQSRVVIRDGEKGDMTCDLSPFRSDSLFEDLKLRDFTINAMAFPLGEDGSLGVLYDPLSGREDLQKKLLRICSPSVLQDDPLRVLKGIRHCLTHGLAIESNTLHAMRAASSLLSQVAPERIRDELFGILSAGSVERGIRLMQELKILTLLLGSSPVGKDYRQGIKLIRQAETWLAALDCNPQAPRARELAKAKIESDIGRDLVLKLGALLKGYGTKDSASVLDRLRCSRRLQDTGRAFQELSGQLFGEFLSLRCGRRGRALWLAALGPDPVACLLFLAVLGGGEGIHKIDAVEQGCEDLHACLVEGRIPDLVDGQWLQRHVGLEQGPEVGRALAALRHEEIAGRVNNRQEAELFLQSFREKNR
ncbi:MAG: hypothetical protein R2940_05255 [Syntrophotaleaceae bacterium]